jgi:signal peptidase II
VATIALTAAVVIGVDQFTKWLVVRDLRHGPVHVVWTLQLNLARNTGAAFSLLSGKGVGPAIALVALAIVACLAVGRRTLRSRLGEIGIGMVLGGALGNLADRLFRAHDGVLSGAVVDFIDFQWWPVFNVADASVVIGVVLVVAATLRHELTTDS